MTFSDVENSRRKASIFEQAAPDNAVFFDASLGEEHAGAAAVTDHPVEKGSDITDHVRREHDTLTLHVIVSNNQIVINRSSNATAVVPGGDPNSRAEDTYDFIRGFKDRAVLCGVVTTLREYSDMLITSVSVARDKDKGTIVDMSIALREVTIAETETVDAPVPVKPPRKPRKKDGKKNATESTPATTKKSEGLLEKVANSLGKVLGG